MTLERYDLETLLGKLFGLPVDLVIFFWFSLPPPLKSSCLRTLTYLPSQFIQDHCVGFYYGDDFYEQDKKGSKFVVMEYK